jgi:hypothetical protein
LNPPTSSGRHLAVDAEWDAKILAWIQRQADKTATVTCTDIKNYWRELRKFEVSRGWVDSLISRDSAELTEKKSSPSEDPRLQVPRIFPEETICSMHGTLQGCPSDLVFNLGEVEISDWEDRKPKKVVIPITVSAHNIHHRISRNVKHMSIVTWISGDGACLTPYVITSQDSAALHRAIEATGMQIGKQLILKHRATPDVNADFFENYIRTVFLPQLAITWIMPNIPEEDAVLLMDNWSPQLSPLVIDLLSNSHVRIVTFAPDTT